MAKPEKADRLPLRGHLRDKIDPIRYAEKSEQIRSGIAPDEYRAWREHPCTKALLYSLDADISGILSFWIAGAYSESDSVDGTAQAQAKARGMAQAINDVIELIHDMKPQEEE